MLDCNRVLSYPAPLRGLAGGHHVSDREVRALVRGGVESGGYHGHVDAGKEVTPSSTSKIIVEAHFNLFLLAERSKSLL